MNRPEKHAITTALRVTCSLALGALLVGAIVSAVPSVAAAAEDGTVALERITLTDNADDAQLALSLSAVVVPHVFRLHDPERLVIDLPGTHRAAPLPVPAPGGLVSALRSGRPEPHELRLVLDLNSARRLQLEQSAQGNSWQVHIAPLSSSTPHAPAAAPAHAHNVPAPIVRAAHAPPDGERPVVIAVDAGHGGNDPGATGQSGTHEKDITLAIARALAERINDEPGMRAVLTRDGDYFVALRGRIERARAAHADMFVSIHADAIRAREVSGASVYILSERGASSEAARSLADEENAADLKGGISLADQNPDLRGVLLNLSQSASMGESSEAADRVLGALDGVGAVRKREVQQAAFVVLKSPDIPSMLVETAYISNPGEERALRMAAQQQRLAAAIFSGIHSYFRQYPPEGSRFARAREAAPEQAPQLMGSGF
jgi:N-acetylmuramoyl-L-alanine amidase